MDLVAQQLEKRYSEREVVRGVSFTLHPGEIVGLLGPNGAGKSTTVGMLYGLVIPTAGTVRLGPYDVRSQGREARQHMGVVSQENNLDPDFNVLGNLLTFARYYRLEGHEARLRAEKLLAQVGLLERSKDSTEALSGGMKRRLVLARALISDPSVVFLDEPTTGLDPDARQDFWRLVAELRAAGRGVVLTTHYMDEAERLCDRLLLMKNGEVVGEGEPEAVIAREVGREVAEVEGIDPAQLVHLANQAGSWTRPFGGGTLVVLPSDGDTLWQAIVDLAPTRLTRRRANLEDVFLRLTGDRL
ncbi:nodulation ABC transporter NodI [Gloeobacter kilaueensis JS1]|uniref:Nodulation ABC transporter NodI n=1 Tax=Gloeobacter kilaueensis (strain ATCC BAA-2537 / CCAP 1431/1 / ULC 316 / JS1) TaxID=1183438 RepID=U5QMH6_GLOK1|nr:nodulation ABC transporter NodI [Gloeobacter kilaueensis JS1]